ncbi:conserved unknown protein [Ectocarpus siliculosus]|uniref:Uncharacterized protein n=1 Tax=Ectocarpus siliculosus TaxID=2880 RepID=D8LH24_ECTSI|nr:conserved unknown protein [Ectocarpus siliculosus]|eukprot:CBN75877.1 conserved unknown protein [Ectocarpus siliculosus]
MYMYLVRMVIYIRPSSPVQDLDHLLRLDAANVGAEVEDKRQRSERLLSKAGNGQLRAVRKKAGDGAAVDTVKDAQALREKARSLLKDAEVKKKLSKEEAKELENDLLKDINTQFGTRNENFALDVYERRCGTEVICSNERILVWPFPGSKISGDGVPDRALDPPPELSQGWTKRGSRRGSGRSSSAAEPALPASAAPERAGQGPKGQGQVISSTRCSDDPVDDAAGSAGSNGNGSGVKRPTEGKREESSPGFAARLRRGSCLPQKAAPSPATVMMTESMTDGDDATARAQQEECRRGSMAETLPPAVAMTETEDKRSSMTSTNGGSTAIASEGSNFGSIYSASGTTPPPPAAAAAAVATATAPGATKTKAGLMNLETFGGDAVYAWGEGPAEPSEPKEEDEAVAEEEEPEEQEWSVWARDTEAVNPPPSEVGPQDAGNGSAAGMEEEPARGAAGWGSKTMRERRKEACFVVVGAVDGVAEEVTDAPEDAESWETRRVVVEVKNRMYKATNPPPLYDQIQLVTYMLMIGASVGDLVQFVKTTTAGRGNGKREVPRKEAPTAVTATADDVLVSRVELDCRTYRHRKHWGQVVLPRLYEFARMVYRFRGDDLLRWRYLLATPEEQRDMLVECCPYLDSVIPRAPATAAAAAAAVPPSLPSPTPGAPKTGLKATGLDGGGAVSGNAPVDTPGSVPGASAPGAAETESKNGGEAKGFLNLWEMWRKRWQRRRR